METSIKVAELIQYEEISESQFYPEIDISLSGALEQEVHATKNPGVDPSGDYDQSNDTNLDEVLQNQALQIMSQPPPSDSDSSDSEYRPDTPPANSGNGSDSELLPGTY